MMILSILLTAALTAVFVTPVVAMAAADRH